jgi:hypothetical protein
LEATQFREVSRLCEDIAQDRRRICKLENPSKITGSSPVGKTTEKRIAEIEKRLKENRGAMAFKELRRQMHLKPNQFSRVIASLDKRRFEVCPLPRSPRQKLLKLKVPAWNWYESK